MLQAQNALIRSLENIPDQLLTCTKRIIPAGGRLYDPGDDGGRVFLVESGVAALTWPDTELGVDVALVGREGMVGAGGFLCGPIATFPAVARSDLTLLEAPTSAFYDALDACPELKSRISGFVINLVQQIAESAFVNARLSVEQRLARWIWLAATRLDSPSISVTHDILASAVGCRRAGITVALHYLEGEHVLRSSRGKVSIVDPIRLRLFARGVDSTGSAGRNGVRDFDERDKCSKAL